MHGAHTPASVPSLRVTPAHSNQFSCHIQDIESLHDEACARSAFTYIDPTTSYTVFTRLAHLKRGTCCGSGCRHCPWRNGELLPGALSVDDPGYITNAGTSTVAQSTTPVTVLFFSGGKDSLTVLHLLRTRKKEVVLLSTYDPTIMMHGIQQVPMRDIKAFAKVWKFDLVTVPVGGGSTTTYEDRVRCALDLVAERHTIEALAFGDIHLQTIRDWREASLSATYTLLFPLWKRETSWLLDRLEESCEAFRVDVRISAVVGRADVVGPDVDSISLAKGDLYDDVARRAISAAGWDLLGENGEFHTRIVLRGGNT